MSKKGLSFLVIAMLLLGGGYVAFRKMHRPYLTVIGPIDMSEGIGRQTMELVEALKGEVSIGLMPTTGINLHGARNSISHLLKLRPTKLGKVIIFEDSFGVRGGTAYKKLKTLKNDDQIRIAYSMFESNRIPGEWVHILNHYFDAVVVPDRFFVDVYKNSGVTIPVFEIPLGLNLGDLLGKPLKKGRGYPMIFANLSAAIPRKNQLKLVRAFHAAFGNSPEVKLRINSRLSDFETRQAIKQEIQNLGLTNVDFTEMVLDKALYLKIFEEVDCYVSLSTGEGFSIQPREAMALGIPAIVSDNTGQATICKSQLVRRVASDVPIPVYYNEFKEAIGHGYDCTLDDAAEAFRDVYEHYDHYLAQGAKAREWVKQYHYPKMRPLYLSLVKPKKVTLGSENRITEGELVTTSSELYRKYLAIQ